MSCVLRRNPRRTDLLLVFAAVKKTAPSSREAIGAEVPDACIFFAAGVPRMRLCSSLFVVQHSTCDPEVNAKCATNEVTQFFVYCKKYTLRI